MLQDQIKATGALTITKNGKVEREINNLVVDAGKSLIAELLTGAGTAVGYMAVGTDGTAAAAGNTTLTAETARVSLSTSRSGAAVTYEATFAPGTATAALKEAGLFNNSVVGTMLARTAFPVVNKTADDTITISWTVTIS